MIQSNCRVLAPPSTIATATVGRLRGGHCTNTESFGHMSRTNAQSDGGHQPERPQNHLSLQHSSNILLK